LTYSGKLKIPGMIMIGGNLRNSGKTSVACSIIKKLSGKQDVIGLKVTSIRPNEVDLHGSHTEDERDVYSILEELNTESEKDTSRMLRAGASRVFYIRVPDENSGEAIADFLSVYVTDQLIVCESRSLRNKIIPGMFIMMMRHHALSNPKPVTEYLLKADHVFNYEEQQFEIQHFIENLHFDKTQIKFDITNSNNNT